MEIDVQLTADTGDAYVFDVRVSENGDATTHRVSLSQPDWQRLSGAADPADLVRRSFEFLLEREPKEQIMAEFDISMISRYFPEYETKIRSR